MLHTALRLGANQGLGLRQDCLALGAIFATTDSVAVIQVLEEERSPLLFSLVFGEGVINDATSVALLRTVQVLVLCTPMPASHSDMDASFDDLASRTRHYSYARALTSGASWTQTLDERLRLFLVFGAFSIKAGFK